ncbi:unnamed protein product [Paramecium octaurelia]|uniref:Uncharacterized protein n=1 Tax=Paramecium octaurelia TaxID=43137 RepID=A0A8S1TQ44_PAROT|nr:unnamed protein product [Paramecium octaurelia]
MIVDQTLNLMCSRYENQGKTLTIIFNDGKRSIYKKYSEFEVQFVPSFDGLQGEVNCQIIFKEIEEKQKKQVSSQHYLMKKIIIKILFQQQLILLFLHLPLKKIHKVLIQIQVSQDLLLFLIVILHIQYHQQTIQWVYLITSKTVDTKYMVRISYQSQKMNQHPLIWIH